MKSKLGGVHTSKFVKHSFIFVVVFFAVVSQDYSTDADHKVYVIIGNSALIKCQIPSFVADFISVTSWVDNDGIEYFPANNNNGIQIKNFEEMGHKNRAILEYFKLENEDFYFIFSCNSRLPNGYK